MPPKEIAKSVDQSTNENRSAQTLTSLASTFPGSEEGYPVRSVSLDIEMFGDGPGPGDYSFLALFRGKTILEAKWENGGRYGTDTLSINLNDPRFQAMVSSEPIIFLLRAIQAKASKPDQEPLLHTDNRAGATVDLFPLVLGEKQVYVTVRLVLISTGEFTGCEVVVRCAASASPLDRTDIPLLLTMISAHCMPLARDGTVYLSAIGLTDICKPESIGFGQSLSTPDAKKLVWSTTSAAGYAANTEFNVPEEDRFIPEDLEPHDTKECRSFYWYAMNRVLVDSEKLINRLSSPLLIEVAGVPKMGKVDVRGRFMGWVDARALLEPAQMNVTVCAKLLMYNEAAAELGGGGLLDLPPTSAKPSARETDLIQDEFGHTAYVVIRLDVMEPLIPKLKLISLYEMIGFPPPDGNACPIYILDTDAVPEVPVVDARRIRKECGALAVHKELTDLACKGSVPMDQSIKRSAANRLLVRVRTMLKNFDPGDCSYIDWQDTVTGQQSAARRAVTASFAPQPPRLRLPGRFAAARCRVAGDDRIGDKHIKANLQVAGRHPRSLICKTIRCLEERNDLDAKNYLFEALNNHTKNRYLLWILGAQEFNNGREGADIAEAAFRISVKGDHSDGTSNAIAWAALHTFHHSNGDIYGAYAAIKKMRKCHSLPKEWDNVLQRWSENSGEEEVFWIPSVIAPDNPILLAAAFFLCLRCFKFCESLLQCVEAKCFTRGSNHPKIPPSPDLYYLRAASFVLRRQLDCALDITEKGIQKFGPAPILCQMRVTCLSCIRGWDRDCEIAFTEAENSGAKACPFVLYKAAFNTFKVKPKLALQRAARVHSMTPSGHTALLLGRIFAKLGDDSVAERWCACAVKVEPCLADAWATLAILAMYQRNLDKARTMLRTARQVGPISSDIEDDLEKLSEIVDLDQLADSLVKNVCIKKKYD